MRSLMKTLIAVYAFAFSLVGCTEIVPCGVQDAGSELVADLGGSDGTGADADEEVIPQCSSVSVVEVSQLSAEHDDAILVLDAPIYAMYSCTSMSCGPSDPCCNICGGDYVFQAPLEGADYCTLLAPGIEKWGCSGDDCDMTCTPFGEPTSDAPLNGKLLLGQLKVKGSLCEFQVIEVCQ